MKKAIFVIMALLTVFAMVSCGGGGGSSKIYVTWDADGGTVNPGRTEVNKGGTVTVLPTPTKTSNMFGGWFTVKNGGGTQFTTSTVVTASITVYAKWTEITPPTPTEWQILFDADGGTVTTAFKNVTKDAAWGTLPTPTKTDNTFGGWFTEKNGGGTEVTAATIAIASITVYAKWTPGAPAGIVITVNLNVPAEYEGAALDAIQPRTLPAAGAIGTLLPGIPTAAGATVEGMAFGGWYLTAACDGDQVVGTTVFSASATIYAKWTMVATNQVVIAFDYNYAITPKSFIKVFTINEAAGEAWPADPTRPDYDFKGWWTYENGNGTEYTSATVLPSDIKETDDVLTVWAKWAQQNAGEEVPPDGMDMTGVEKVTIGNGFKVIYKFELPVGKTYADYKDIIAKYMVGPSNYEKAGMPRTTRIHGNYVDGDFGFITGVTGSSLPNGAYAAANFNNGKNAEYIMGAIDGTNQSGTITVKQWTQTNGLDVNPWEWFGVTYPLDGTNKHANFVAANMPAGTAAGPFYFGIGFDTVSGDGGTHYIKEVIMEGQTGIPNVVGTPLYLKSGETTYPAFCGYLIPEGTNGCGSAYRRMVRDEDQAAIAPVVLTWKVTLDLNYTGAPAAEAIYVNKGAAATTLPITATNPDGVFVGWNTAPNGTGDAFTVASIPTADITLYAQWATQMINITFDGDGGTPAAATKEIGKGGTLAPADLVITKPGYLLDKWVIMPAGTEAIVPSVTAFTADTTIKALWNVAVTVKFDISTGAAPTSVVILKGTALGNDNVPANPTRSGQYDFIGWNTRADGKGLQVSGATKFNQNATVYAIWQAKNLAPADLVYLSTTIPGAKYSTAKRNSAALGDYGTTADLQWTIADMDIPAGFNLTSYKSYTIKIKFYSDSGYTTEVDTSALGANINVAQLKFSTHISDRSDTYSGNTRVLYNLGTTSGANGTGRLYGIDESFPAAVIDQFAATPILSMFVQRGPITNLATAVYFEITDIIFHTALAGGSTVLTVDDTTFADPLFNTIANQEWKVSTGNLTITVPASYASYKWTINGVSNAETSRTLTLLGKDYANKINTNITVTALVKDATGKLFSKTIVVAVKR